MIFCTRNNTCMSFDKTAPRCQVADNGCKSKAEPAKSQCPGFSAVAPCCTPDEFELMDKLATMLGIASPESEEERNTDQVYQRRVLRAAITELTKVCQKQD